MEANHIEKMSEQERIDFVVSTYNKSLKILSSTLESKITDDQISFDMFMIIHFIAKACDGNITLSEIAEKQYVTKSAVSRKVGILLDLGYIDQVTDRVDRRKKYLLLTQMGRSMYKQNEARFDKMLSAISSDYGGNNFMLTLQHINQILEIIKKSNHGL